MESSENITRYYLIDYENVHQTGLNGIENLTENDIVVIFYTENAETLTFSLYEKLVQCKAEIQLCKVQCGGKNALDFQLATFLGYILGNNSDTECHIISNDKGYEYVISFWKEKDIEIKLSSNITEALRPETDFDKAIKPLNLSKEDKNKLYGIYCGSAHITDISQRKQSVNQTIIKHFGSDKAIRYYRAIKSLIKEDSPAQVSENPELSDKIPENETASAQEQDIIHIPQSES
ncbi:MAG: hypothetical protein K2J40_02680 [Ruminococcus sp.]|nr:hypothetical protein [Ruminococcus sp.]